MENKIQIFEIEGFDKLRTLNKNGKLMFVALDVAKFLGYPDVDEAILTHCRYVTRCDISHPQGKGTLEVSIIPEGDVYRLIAYSTPPFAP